MSLHPIRRTFKLLTWPLSRPLAAGLLWSHRHTIGLWARSYGTELTAQYEGSVSPSRLRLLTSALWRVSSDPRFRNDPSVRRLTIYSEIVEVNRDARAASLHASLADLPGVVGVEIDGQTETKQTIEVDTVHANGETDTTATDRIISPAR